MLVAGGDLAGRSNRKADRMMTILRMLRLYYPEANCNELILYCSHADKKKDAEENANENLFFLVL